MAVDHYQIIKAKWPKKYSNENKNIISLYLLNIFDMVYEIIELFN